MLGCNDMVRLQARSFLRISVMYLLLLSGLGRLLRPGDPRMTPRMPGGRALPGFPLQHPPDKVQKVVPSLALQRRDKRVQRRRRWQGNHSLPIARVIPVLLGLWASLQEVQGWWSEYPHHVG